MIIDRVQVEGGFLSGLDITLSTGLNVIIGARGTGKTSLIEIIRYGLSVKNLTTESKTRSFEQINSVLRDGEVTIALTDFFDEVVVSRGFEEESPRSTGNYVSPIILSQTEIENVGLSESGRLALIDGFLPGRQQHKARIAEVINFLKSVFKEIEGVERELEALGDGIQKFEEYRFKIHDLEEQQKKIQGDLQLENKQFALASISAELADYAVKSDVLQRFQVGAEAWYERMEEQLFEDYGLEDWNAANGDDPLLGLRAMYQNAIGQLEHCLSTFKEMKQLAKQRLAENESSRILLEQKARELRQDLDQDVAGAGAIAKQISTLKSHAAQIQARQKIIADRRSRLETLRRRRDEKLNELTEIRAERSVQRMEVIRNINEALAPWVRVELQQSAQLSEYSRSIANALRGSGMKYNDLANTISARISPQELLYFVEERDFDALSDITGVPRERSARIISHLAEAGVGEIVVSEIEDSLRFTLLDGVERKEISGLSAGQRCTLILSIVLQHNDRTLIIDQPEDHLDNSYITGTIIQALLRRKKHSQIILSTHNANIPVLGRADLVIQMVSDGKNGFVQSCVPLEDSRSVSAITNVMEGGVEAFTARSNFYEGHM